MIDIKKDIIACERPTSSPLTGSRVAPQIRTTCKRVSLRMNISGAVVFVTGASRGLGRAFAQIALAQGAKKVYAGVRDPSSFDIAGLVPIKLDVTDEASVQAAAAQCQDTTLLINNAGIAMLTEDALDPQTFELLSRQMFDTNFYGVVRASKAFAPVLAKNGGGAIINVLSDATWLSIPILAAYAASKSAAWSFTNALRLQVRSAGTQVLALHVGFVDTELTKDLDVPKSSKESVVKTVFGALEAGSEEVLADEGTQAIKASLSTASAVYLNPPMLG